MMVPYAFFLIYKIEIVGVWVWVYVCMYVCMFAYSSRMDKPICTKHGMLILWDQEEILERLKLRKSVLSSSPGEGGSCTSETKRDRKTAPRPKLLPSTIHSPEKLSWVRVPVNVSVARKISTTEERITFMNYIYQSSILKLVLRQP
jgi:hypothetical protein